MTTPKVTETAVSHGHHPDCDGFRLAHRVTVMRDGSMRRAVCVECGPLHVDAYGPSVPVEAMYSDHEHNVACDGRCSAWGGFA